MKFSLRSLVLSVLLIAALVAVNFRVIAISLGSKIEYGTGWWKRIPPPEMKGPSYKYTLGWPKVFFEYGYFDIAAGRQSWKKFSGSALAFDGLIQVLIFLPIIVAYRIAIKTWCSSKKKA